MVSMQSWLPARGSGIVGRHTVPILACVVLQAQLVLGFENSVIFVRPGSSSTLDARVSPQASELNETVLDIFDGDLLGESGPPTKPAAKLKAPSPDAPAARPLPKPSASPKKTTAQASPFRKWVKPEGAKPQEETSPSLAAPKLANRPRTSVREPLPLPPKQSPSVDDADSAKPTEAEAESEQADETPTTAEPKPTNYPKPASDQPKTEAAAKNLPPLTRSQISLRSKIRKVLTHYYNRPLNTRDRSPWELMHAMLAFEAHSKVLQGGPRGEPITAVGWLCYNQACKRRTLMYVNDDGELRVRVGPALQGHRGQLLAMLAQSRINENYPMLVESHELKIADLIEMEKRTCYPRTELTFKLIGLMHYLDSDATWLNDQGMEWNIPRLISEELRQPVRGAACGGTHRLAGLTLAYKTRIKRGEPVDGEYLRAKRFVQRYQQYAYRLQNRDGSFSTEWFRGPGNEESIDRKLKTTGHILEWLLYAATEKELKHWKTTKAVNYLANIMYRNRYKDWEAGPLGHAIHALLVYDRLMFSPYDPPEVLPMATNPSRPNNRR